MINKGLFISLEGLDCSGKSTIAKLLSDYFIKKKYSVINTREPGGNNIIFCEQIRNILLDKNSNIDNMSEALLFSSSRSEHVKKLLIPKLNEGAIVICDRYLDSSLVYQGYAKKLGIDNILEINKHAINDLFPDITLLLDINLETYNKRMSQRDNLDRLDVSSLNLKQEIINGYHEVARRYSNRIKIIDANNDISKVFNDVISIIESNFEV